VHYIIYRCLNAQRHPRASLCAAHEEESRAKFHHEVSLESGCRAFSHKSFALPVKIMSTSKKITLLCCFRAADTRALCSDCLQPYRTSCYALCAIFCTRVVYTLSLVSIICGPGLESFSKDKRDTFFCRQISRFSSNIKTFIFLLQL